jgi:hypothetical protein
MGVPFEVPAESERTIDLELAGEKDYALQVIDTWNMKIGSEKKVSAGQFQYKTELPFTAVRLRAR